VVIADDHKLVAEAFKRLLEPEFEVVDIVFDGRTLVQSVDKLKPDVVLADIGMPQLNGLDAGAQIKKRNHKIKVIYLTILADPDVAAEAFRRGASGYLVKQCGADELTRAVRTVVRGQSYLCPMITRDTVGFLLRTPAERRGQMKISGRQAEVLQLLAEGKPMKEIAFILHITRATVAFHKYRIMQVLGVRTSAGLIEYALKHHMIDNIREERALTVINDRSELQKIRAREERSRIVEQF
jgi:DNA-binding NarL/FixJ family response regulator